MSMKNEEVYTSHKQELRLPNVDINAKRKLGAKKARPKTMI